MNKHRLNIVLTLSWVILVFLLNILCHAPLLWTLPGLIVHIMILIYGVLNLDFNYFFKSYTNARTSKKRIALSFDDGPVPQTLELLEVLSQHQASASFFCIGKNIALYPEIAKEIHAQGHILGNHSYNHAHNFDFYSTLRVLKELEDCSLVIQKTIGKKPLFFRPPNGVSNPMIAKALKQTKLKSIAWNIRTFDTQIKNPERLFKATIAKIKPGSIILMHDTMPHTTKLVSMLLKYCKEHHYEIVGINELLNLPAYE